MTEKIKRILKDRKGTSFPLVIAVTLALILLFCCPQYHKTFPLKMALVIFCAFKDEIKITINPKAML